MKSKKMNAPAKKLYIVSAGIWDIDPAPRATVECYEDYISEFIPSGDCSIDEYLEYDDSRLTYEQLKEIADKNHDWRNMLYADDDWIAGSVMLTEKEAEKLEKTFFLMRMSELLTDETENV
jgi:hypothetical protein